MQSLQASVSMREELLAGRVPTGERIFHSSSSSDTGEDAGGRGSDSSSHSGDDRSACRLYWEQGRAYAEASARPSLDTRREEVLTPEGEGVVGGPTDPPADEGKPLGGPQDAHKDGGEGGGQAGVNEVLTARGPGEGGAACEHHPGTTTAPPEAPWLPPNPPVEAFEAAGVDLSAIVSGRSGDGDSSFGDGGLGLADDSSSGEGLTGEVVQLRRLMHALDEPPEGAASGDVGDVGDVGDRGGERVPPAVEELEAEKRRLVLCLQDLCVQMTLMTPDDGEEGAEGAEMEALAARIEEVRAAIRSVDGRIEACTAALR
jgi:hypothetical protein